ncbi:MAG: LptA/OstA family protein [Candidatus Tritonobacter lacicola]|nr:LptA/OstA family protein [Candidatus Tritonobacter lacicola]
MRIIAAIILSFTALAEAANAAQQKMPTTITSDILEVDYADYIGTFEKNVIVTDPKGRMTGDRIVVFFDSKGKEIKRIEAYGDVVIKLEGRESNSQKAVYTPDDGKIVLTGEPRIEEGRNIYAADKITIYRWEDRVIFEPRARFILHKEGWNNR